MTSSVLAGAPGDCCAKSINHTGTPVGRTVSIADVPTYISEPPTGTPGDKRIVLFFSDIYGPLYLNNQLIQDYFASQGFTVIGVDYFFGDPVQNHATETNFDRPAWVEKVRGRAAEAVPRWLEEVKKIYGNEARYCAVGYCFGAPFSLNLATTDSVVASAFVHPALINEDQIRNVKKPFFMSCAETDHTFPLEARRRAEDILVEIKATYHIQVFSGVSHGFASRGDPAVENIRWAKEESARSVIGWFKRFTTVEGRA